jgi:hypothetical protein
MQINRVFDFIGPSGFIPNGVNYKYTSDMWDSNFYIDNIFIDEFNKKYLQIAVYDCNLNIGPFNITDIHIFDLRYDEESNVVGNPTDNYFYTITRMCQSKQRRKRLEYYISHPFCIFSFLEYNQQSIHLLML